MGEIEPPADPDVTDLEAQPAPEPAAAPPPGPGVADLRPAADGPPADPNLPAKQAYLARKAKERRGATVARLILGAGVLAGVVGLALIGSWLLDEDPEAPANPAIVGALLLGAGFFVAVVGVRLLVAVRPVVNRFSGWQWQVKAP